MSKKTIKPVFWIHGNYYDTRKCWQKIIAKVDNPNIENMDCGSNPSNIQDGLRFAAAADVISLLKSRDMFDDRPRIIRMRGLPPDYTIIADYLHFISDSNILVVDSPVGYYQDRRFIPASASSFYKKISTEGKVFDCGTEAKTDSDAKAWIENVLEDMSKDIKPDACQMLISMKGRDYDSLLVEINRLVAYQAKKTITIEDVKECSIPAYTKTAWELIDMLDDNRFEDAFAQIQQFYQFAGLASGESFRGEIEKLMGALHYHYLFLLFVKDACGEYYNYDKVAKAVEGYRRPSKDEDKKSDYFSKAAVGASSRSEPFKRALRNRTSKIYASYLAVCRCMSRIRMLYSEEMNKVCLDSLCMYICGIINESQMMGMLGYTQGN